MTSSVCNSSLRLSFSASRRLTSNFSLSNLNSSSLVAFKIWFFSLSNSHTVSVSPEPLLFFLAVTALSPVESDHQKIFRYLINLNLTTQACFTLKYNVHLPSLLADWRSLPSAASLTSFPSIADDLLDFSNSFRSLSHDERSVSNSVYELDFSAVPDL